MNKGFSSLSAVAVFLLLGACSAQPPQNNNAMRIPEKNVVKLGLAGVTSPHSASAEPSRTPDGIVITPIVDKQPDEFAELFNAKYWRFDITIPASKKAVHFKMTMMHKPNGAIIMEQTIPSSLRMRHFELIVALAPVGETWENAYKMKTFYVLKDVNPSINSVNKRTSVTTFINPFANRYVTETYPSTLMEKNGDVCLLKGWLIPKSSNQKPINKSMSIKTTPGSENVAIMLQLKAI